MTDNIAALQGLISNLVVNANELLPKLGGTKIINATCKIVDVEENNVMIKKCCSCFQSVFSAKGSGRAI
jgi:hypothetical protein